MGEGDCSWNIHISLKLDIKIFTYMVIVSKCGLERVTIGHGGRVLPRIR